MVTSAAEKVAAHKIQKSINLTFIPSKVEASKLLHTAAEKRSQVGLCVYPVFWNR